MSRIESDPQDGSEPAGVNVADAKAAGAQYGFDFTPGSGSGEPTGDSTEDRA
ncbi:hypothetical protein GCM10023195_84060 [Actinoallomurus liliacearum]|uniref:Uncharacterized protein n=1 Tax=Actinoallomurus liliacearum TaxID=1080073 RepID=A0ABP8TX69_9ACTN